ncbi:MAG: hypothetical protein AB7I24_08645 [Candidatus Nanopelagicales bacterium]
MQVGRDVLAEHRELGVPVAPGDVAEELVVAAVLAYEEEDVLDRPVGAQDGVHRRCGRVGGALLVVGRARERDDLGVVGQRHEPGRPDHEVGVVADPAEDVGRGRLGVERPEDRIGRVRGVGPVRVGADAHPFGRDVVEHGALRRLRGEHRLGLVRGGDAPDLVPRVGLVGIPLLGVSLVGHADDDDLVGSRIRHEQARAVGRQRHRDGLGAKTGGAPHEQGGLDHAVGKVHDRDLVAPGDRDEGARAVGAHCETLRMRQRRSDGDVAHLHCGAEIDDRQRARRLVGDEARSAVRQDRGPIGVAAGRDVPHGIVGHVHDRRRTGEVEGHQQRRAVRRYRELLRPRGGGRGQAGPRRRVRLQGRRILLRGDRDGAQLGRLSAGGRVLDDVHDIAVRPRQPVLGRRPPRVRQSRDIDESVVGVDRDTA